MRTSHTPALKPDSFDQGPISFHSKESYGGLDSRVFRGCIMGADSISFSQNILRLSNLFKH